MSVSLRVATCVLAGCVSHAARADEPLAPRWTVDRLLAETTREVERHSGSPSLRRDFEALAGRHGLPADDSGFRAYAKVKAVFEATREAGWWRLAWDVTDREPQSDAIWAAWRRTTGVPRVTAVAECDESSALAAVVLRGLGVRAVGLFWPTSNHTVAVWKARTRDGRDARIVLPTSQVFLDPMDGFDTRAFDAGRQRAIYDYSRADVRGADAVPEPLARFFVQQVGRYAGASDETQRSLRVLRARFMSGASRAAVEPERLALERRLRARRGAERDLAAVEAFAAEVDSR